MRTFVLIRKQDITGVSGVGTVAEGVEFTDGTVAMRWLSEARSTVIWPSLDTAMTVHGHDGSTEVKVLWEQS